MRLNPIELTDRGLFNKFLNYAERQHSAYAFENIYIWKGLFDIRWAVWQDSLCVFFRDKIGSFMYLPPLSGSKNPEAIKMAFSVMDGWNRNKEISRIENLEEEDLGFYEGLGYTCRYKSCDYLCKRSDLAQLKGGAFKSKRACRNYFIKHYKFEYLPFRLQHGGECMKLYSLWMEQRGEMIQDTTYQGMLRDSLSCLKILLCAYKGLGVIGRIVRVNKEIKAFSFGFRINKDTFCILYEITDLSIKGLAQYIFQRFCSELAHYAHINIMDDSGLDNLKKVKLSYRPARLIPAYIATRKDVSKLG